MKKLMVLMVLLFTLLTVTKATYATTTLFLGQTIEGSGTSYDNTNIPFSGNVFNNVINFTDITEIKKIKIDIDYEFGDFKYNQGPPTLGLWDIQVGYPAIKNDKGLVYVTLGALNYTEYSQYYPKHEANGNMLGLDIICTPTDRFQFELDLQHSFLGGSSKVYFDDGSGQSTTKDSSPDLTTFKIKIQYIFTDNFGVAVHYRVMDYQVKESPAKATDLKTTAIGLIYRF